MEFLSDVLFFICNIKDKGHLVVQFGGGGWLGRLKMIRGLNGVEMI